MKKLAGIRLVGYARCSTDEQANGYSLAAQRAEMERWAEANGAEVVAFFIDVMSTRRVDRLVGRDAAMTAVEAYQEADGETETALLVRALDRATRSMIDGGNLLTRARANGWRLLSVDGVDSDDEDQSTAVDTRLFVAQVERDLISRRTKEGLARAKANGKQLGKRPNVKVSTALRIQALRDDGLSFARIAKVLDEADIATPGTSTRWRAATVQNIWERTAKGVS